ncbi:MAG: Ribosomal large subunit pseudouridine synthase A [Phycisphaerae bacterium]|nr:Ribosomal large subunit pseudouridine synthase A [Phycisphaerae bacterium]
MLRLRRCVDRVNEPEAVIGQKGVVVSTLKRSLIPILHQDESLVVISKPAGLQSVPGRQPGPSVLSELVEQRAVDGDTELRSVHRLDQETSGAMIVAKTAQAQRELIRQFAAREVQKRYQALVRGQLVADQEIDLPLEVDRNRMRVRVARRRGLQSLTRVHVLQPVGSFTLVECEPVTGRMHQIRVHLAAVEHPLAVDAQYGSGKGIYLSEYKVSYRPGAHVERPLIDRLTLHAQSISFIHPTTGERMKLEAPWPKDFRATITQLSRISA